MKPSAECPTDHSTEFAELLKQAVVDRVQLRATFSLRPSLKDKSADGAKHAIKDILILLHNRRHICIPQQDDVLLYKRVSGDAVGQRMEIRFMVLNSDFCPSREWEYLLYFLTDLDVDNKI